MKLKFLNEIKNEEKNINDKIFRDYFWYQTPSFLVKHLYEVDQDKNEETVDLANDELIELKNSAIRKDIPENENQNKIINIVEKLIDFNEYKKGRSFKIWTPRQIVQRLPVAFVQVKASNTFENLLNKIHQIICFCIEQNKLLKMYITMKWIQ